MSAVDDDTRKQSRPTGIGPGERLQAARIQQGLSLEDVASRMHLSASILEAIEDNNFEEITAPIFVKGYLRHYARIVALDEDEMIQQYREYYSEEDPPISSTSNMAPELSVADARIKWTTYLVILALAALLAAWWWNKGQNDEPTISLDTQTSSPEQSDQAAAERVDSEIEAASETPETTEPVQAATQQPIMEEPVQVEPEAAEPAAPEPVEPVEPIEPIEPVAMQQSEQVETSADEATEEASDSAQPDRNVPGLIAPTGSDKLRIRVNADTWTVVEDSSGYLMVRDLLRVDESVELTGAAPFSVFLGNGHGVEIEFNGEEVDFSTRIRDNNTARLKIGG
jgi:cytoskeleton protein RodZ